MFPFSRSSDNLLKRADDFGPELRAQARAFFLLLAREFGYDGHVVVQVEYDVQDDGSISDLGIYEVDETDDEVDDEEILTD
jgi:hypothetical protein